MPGVTLQIEAQLTVGLWTDLTEDVIASAGVSLRYGIEGTGPMDLVASTGELRFSLRNDAGNSAGILGYYSPLHAARRSGWALGIPVRAVLSSGAANTALSLTSAGLTATATTDGAHGLASGTYVTIAGADQPEYNGTFLITVTGADTFTYQLPSAGTVFASIWLLLGTIEGPDSPATGVITWGVSVVKFVGKIGHLLPVAGQYLSRRVEVTVYDGMRDLMDAQIRELDIAVDQDEASLLTQVLNAVPADAQPVARDLDTGLDVFPYAFDNLGSGLLAGGLINDLAVSSYGMVFIQGDGTFRYLNRHSRILAASAFTFTDDTIRALTVPASTDRQYTQIRATTHPKRIDAEVTVLFELTGQPESYAPAQTREIWGDYRSSDDKTRLIGAVNRIAPLVPGVDYRANDMADGTGPDRTNDFSVTVDDFATTAKFTVVNNYTATAYLRILQIRGQAVLDDGPQTFEAPTVPAPLNGDRTLSVDLPYQDDPFIGESTAVYIGLQHGAHAEQFESVEFHGNLSSTLLTQALTREPGDVIRLSETVTGLAAAEAIITRVEVEIKAPDILLARYGLAHRDPFFPWQLGVAGYGELGETTRLGF